MTIDNRSIHFPNAKLTGALTLVGTAFIETRIVERSCAELRAIVSRPRPSK
jgi:hypothetical protein